MPTLVFQNLFGMKGISEGSNPVPYNFPLVKSTSRATSGVQVPIKFESLLQKSVNQISVPAMLSRPSVDQNRVVLSDGFLAQLQQLIRNISGQENLPQNLPKVGEEVPTAVIGFNTENGVMLLPFRAQVKQISLSGGVQKQGVGSEKKMISGENPALQLLVNSGINVQFEGQVAVSLPEQSGVSGSTADSDREVVLPGKIILNIPQQANASFLQIELSPAFTTHLSTGQATPAGISVSNLVPTKISQKIFSAALQGLKNSSTATHTISPVQFPQPAATQPTEGTLFASREKPGSGIPLAALGLEAVSEQPASPAIRSLLRNVNKNSPISNGKQPVSINQPDVTTELTNLNSVKGLTVPKLSADTGAGVKISPNKVQASFASGQTRPVTPVNGSQLRDTMKSSTTAAFKQPVSTGQPGISTTTILNSVKGLASQRVTAVTNPGSGIIPNNVQASPVTPEIMAQHLQADLRSVTDILITGQPTDFSPETAVSPGKSSVLQQVLPNTETRIESTSNKAQTVSSVVQSQPDSVQINVSALAEIQAPELSGLNQSLGQVLPQEVNLQLKNPINKGTVAVAQQTARTGQQTAPPAEAIFLSDKAKNPFKIISDISSKLKPNAEKAATESPVGKPELVSTVTEGGSAAARLSEFARGVVQRSVFQNTPEVQKPIIFTTANEISEIIPKLTVLSPKEVSSNLQAKPAPVFSQTQPGKIVTEFENLTAIHPDKLPENIWYSAKTQSAGGKLVITQNPIPDQFGKEFVLSKDQPGGPFLQAAELPESSAGKPPIAKIFTPAGKQPSVLNAHSVQFPGMLNRENGLISTVLTETPLTTENFREVPGLKKGVTSGSENSQTNFKHAKSHLKTPGMESSPTTVSKIFSEEMGALFGNRSFVKPDSPAVNKMNHPSTGDSVVNEDSSNASFSSGNNEFAHAGEETFNSAEFGIALNQEKSKSKVTTFHLSERIFSGKVSGRHFKPSGMATASPSTFTDSMDLISSLAKQFQLALKSESKEMFIQLHPEHLGLLRLKLKMDHDKFSGRVEVTSPEVQQLLTRHSKDLTQRLQELNISMDSLEFSLRDSHKEQFSHQGNTNSHQTGKNGGEYPGLIVDSPEGMTSSKKVLGYNTFEYIA